LVWVTLRSQQRAGPEAGGFCPAVLNTGFHHAQEAADAICFLAAGLPKCLEAVDQFR
jgi:hypothetical protein